MTMSMGRPFSVADLEAMPDDGRRYELIDGELLVTPGSELASPGGCLHAVHGASTILHA